MTTRETDIHFSLITHFYPLESFPLLIDFPRAIKMEPVIPLL